MNKKRKGSGSEKQGHSLQNRFIGSGEDEDAGQDGTDAGGPAERKGESQNKGSNHSTRLCRAVKASILVEERNLKDPDEMKAKLLEGIVVDEGHKWWHKQNRIKRK